jgi:iron complex outermembrane receptor protein
MPWKNYQVPVHIDAPPYGFQTNIGDARIYGLESSVEAHPVAGLRLSLTVNYDNATLLSNAWQSPTYVVVPGQRLAEAPEFNASAAVRYEWPVASGPRAYAQVDAARKGSMWNDLRLDHRISQPGYTLANLRVGLGPAHEAWRAEAYVSNLLNTRAIVFANYNAFSTLGQYDIVNEPRVFGLRLSCRYGKAY